MRTAKKALNVAKAVKKEVDDLNEKAKRAQRTLNVVPSSKDLAKKIVDSILSRFDYFIIWGNKFAQIQKKSRKKLETKLFEILKNHISHFTEQKKISFEENTENISKKIWSFLSQFLSYDGNKNKEDYPEFSFYESKDFKFFTVASLTQEINKIVEENIDSVEDQVGTEPYEKLGFHSYVTNITNLFLIHNQFDRMLEFIEIAIKSKEQYVLSDISLLEAKYTEINEKMEKNFSDKVGKQSKKLKKKRKMLLENKWRTFLTLINDRVLNYSAIDNQDNVNQLSEVTGEQEEGIFFEGGAETISISVEQPSSDPLIIDDAQEDANASDILLEREESIASAGSEEALVVPDNSAIAVSSSLFFEGENALDTLPNSNQGIVRRWAFKWMLLKTAPYALKIAYGLVGVSSAIVGGKILYSCGMFSKKPPNQPNLPEGPTLGDYIRNL